MLEIPDCTLVLVETRDSNKAKRTMEHNLSLCNFKDILFVGSEKINLSVQHHHYQSNINTIEQYNNFMVHELPLLIKTKRMLITQTDGYIINPEAWTDNFLQYDYIGAPWWYFPYNTHPSHGISTPSTCVGNGGFSLRSAELMRVVGYLTQDKNINTSPEDLYICRTISPELVVLGYKFAPEDLALQFSCEDRKYTNQFGIHGHETLKLNPQKDIHNGK